MQEGTIIYASHSVEPFDRLECHLSYLRNKIPLLTNETRIQLRLLFEIDSQNQFIEDNGNVSNQPSEYQAINWLINQRYLDNTQAAVLIQELVKEVIESDLLIKTGSYQLSDSPHHLPMICRLNAEKTIECCQMQLQSWQSFAPQISSPYQRLYPLITSAISSKI